MENLSLKEFAAALSGKEPVPGGGGASACTGSYGCALGMMACALTHGKKKYACYEQDIKRIEGELAVCRDTLLSCINEDAQGFLPLSKAYGLPKDTPEQKAKKDEVLEKALHQASLTPMKILKNSAYAMTLLDELSGKCSKLILSDVVTGAAASSYIPSFSTIMESTIPPVATSLFSIALTVPDTEECMLADINPPFSAIFCPTRTLSPALTSGLAIAPICWDNGYTRVSPGLSISMGHSLDIFFPS